MMTTRRKGGLHGEGCPCRSGNHLFAGHVFGEEADLLRPVEVEVDPVVALGRVLADADVEHRIGAAGVVPTRFGSVFHACALAQLAGAPGSVGARDGTASAVGSADWVGVDAPSGSPPLSCRDPQAAVPAASAAAMVATPSRRNRLRRVRPANRSSDPVSAPGLVGGVVVADQGGGGDVGRRGWAGPRRRWAGARR